MSEYVIFFKIFTFLKRNSSSADISQYWTCSLIKTLYPQLHFSSNNLFFPNALKSVFILWYMKYTQDIVFTSTIFFWDEGKAFGDTGGAITATKWFVLLWNFVCPPCTSYHGYMTMYINLDISQNLWQWKLSTL